MVFSVFIICLLTVNHNKYRAKFAFLGREYGFFTAYSLESVRVPPTKVEKTPTKAPTGPRGEPAMLRIAGAWR
jgi:hypothetical protein